MTKFFPRDSEMPLKSKSKNSNRCSELNEEDGTQSNTKSLAETTAEGRYKCQFCGRIFETLKQHDEHYQEMHGQSQAYLTVEDQS